MGHQPSAALDRRALGPGLDHRAAAMPSRDFLDKPITEFSPGSWMHRNSSVPTVVDGNTVAGVTPSEELNTLVGVDAAGAYRV
jgi:hypothetical protein